MKNNKRISTIVLLITIFVSINSLIAQNETNERSIGTSFYFNYEISEIDLVAFNQVLNENGFISIQEPKSAFGFGYLLQVGRSIFSLSYSALEKTNEDSANECDVIYSTFCIDYGFDIIKDAKISLYPYTAFKNNNLTINYREKVSDMSFTNYLSSPLMEKNFYNTRSHFAFGLGVSYQKWIQVGIKGGYMLPVGKNNISIHGGTVDLNDAPEIEYPFFVNVFVGFGFFKNKGSKKATIDEL